MPLIVERNKGTIFGDWLNKAVIVQDWNALIIAKDDVEVPK